MSPSTSALILAWLAILVLTAAVAGLTRQIAILRAGTRAPTLRLGDSSESPVPPRLSGISYSEAPRTLLLFTEPGCSACEKRIADLEELAPPDAAVVLLVNEEAADRGLSSSLRVLSASQAQYAAAGAYATPFGIVVDSAGAVLDARTLGSRAQVREFLNHFDHEGAHQ